MFEVTMKDPNAKRGKSNIIEAKSWAEAAKKVEEYANKHGLEIVSIQKQQTLEI